MITLNTDSVTIEIPERVFGTPLVLRHRDSGEVFGHLLAKQDNGYASVQITNDGVENFEKEALLTFSQYLLHRQAIRKVALPVGAGGHGFACVDGFVSAESIRSYASTLPVVRVAIVIVKNEAGEILLGKRPEGLYLPGLWEFPGGKIEAFESPEDAGHREIMEEIGIEIQNSSELTQVNYCFLANRLEGHLRLTTAWKGIPKNLHHSEILWARPCDLVSYQMPVSNVLALPQILALLR